MPSTFTNNGGIELPADGEKDGVWGDVVNLNMQIVDRLTNGVGAVSLTGTTHDLITANGTLSGDGQYALVVFGGAPSGTNTVTIVPNDAEKVYFIRNATAQSVIMSQGSGGNVTIPAGAGAIVYANGAGTGAAVADLTATFVPDLSNAGITASAAELNILDGVTASTAELNILDGVTASTAELNHVDGVTSAIQTQINAKQATVTGAATTIVTNNLTTSRVLVSDGSGKVAVSGVTAAELNHVDGVTSPIQTQINAKQATITGAATTITSDDLAVSRALVSDASGKVAVSAVTAAELAVLDGITASTAELNLLDGVTASTAELNLLDGVTATTAEINYLSGVTSAIQDQIDNIPAPPELTQVQVEDDTSTVFGQVSGQRLGQAVAAFQIDGGNIAADTVDGSSLVDLSVPVAKLETGTSLETAWVGAQTAGLSIRAVGSYAFAERTTTGTNSFGSTIAGSLLRATDITGTNGTSLSLGTWRCMGQTGGSGTLWLRIS